MLEHHTDAEIITILNARGLKPGHAAQFNRLILFKLRQAHRLADRFTRLRQRGLLTQEEISAQLGVNVTTVQCWRRARLLVAHCYNDKGGHLYEVPGHNAPRKQQGKPLRIRQAQLHAQHANEVQCSA